MKQAKLSGRVGGGTMKQGPSERRVRIPVRLVEGTWEFLFGGQVPIKDGAIAEMVVNRGAIDDKSFLEKMEWRETYKVLDQTTPLFTSLSELFEPWRISHTGNIYKHVLYQERNGKWYRLNLLRNGVLAEKEHEIAQALWSAFLAKMAGARSL